MTLNEKLLAVCNCEQTIYEKEERIKQTNAEIKRIEETAADERTRLTKILQDKRRIFEETNKERIRKLGYSPEGLKIPLTITVIAIVATVIFHILMNYCIVNVACATHDEDTILTLVIMNILPMILICGFIFIFDVELKYLIIIGIIGDAALTFLGVTYFDSCLSAGQSFSTAIFTAMTVFVVIEIIIGAIACYFTNNSQQNELSRARRKAQTLKTECNKLSDEISNAEKNIMTYNSKVNTAITNMKRDRTLLENEVKQLKSKRITLYSQSTVHPKYQTWVAVATFYEYLDVGRCYELKGPHGAYNMYEQELIANKILGSLNAIQANTSGIYSSQFFIRGQLDSIKREIARIPVKTYGM